MKHQIIVQDANGKITERIDVTDGLEVTLKVGEDVVLLDETGKASDAKLKPDGSDLVLVYDEGVEVKLIDFYAEVADADIEPIEQLDPVEVAFNGGVETIDSGGDGSEGLGNLQSDSAFTLINGSLVSLNDQGRIGLGNVEGAELSGGGDGQSEIVEASAPQVITETETQFFSTAAPQVQTITRSSSPNPTLPTGPTTIDGDLDDPDEAPKIDPTKDITITSLETGDEGDPGESVVGGNSSIVFNDDGSYIVTIDPDSTAEDGDSEIYRVVYTDDGSVTQTRDIIVEYDGEGSANVHPFSEDADLSLVSDEGAKKGDLVGYDTDGDTVSHEIVGNPVGSFGTIVIDDPATGEYTYTPDVTKSPAPGETVTDTFDFVVIDEDGATSTSSITVNITGADLGPKATDDAYSITEDGGVDLTAPGLLANDTNDGGGTNRIDSFFVDDQGFIVEEGKEVTTDLGQGTLTIGSDGKASFDAQGGYDHLVEGESVVESLTYSVRDENGKSSQAGVTFTINGQNDGPEITENDFPIEEGEPLILTPDIINADDPDNGPEDLTWCPQDITGGYFDLVANPGVPIAEFTQQQVIDGEVRFVDDGDETAPTFTLYVKDPDGLDDEEPSNITFGDDNDGPEILENVLEVAEGESVVLSKDDLDTTDPDNTPAEILLTPSDVVGGQFELVADPGNSINSFTQQDVYDGKVRFVHNGDEPAPSYTITATDPAGLSDSSDAGITYTPVNDPPEILIAKLPIDEGETVILGDDELYSEDPDHGPEDLTYEVIKVENGEFQLVITGVPVTQFTQEQITNGEIQFVHNGGEDAPCFTIEVSDPPGLTDREDAEILFGNTNDGPEILTNVLTVAEGGSQVFGPTTLNAEDSDHDADDLTFSVDSIAGGEFQRDGSTVTSFTQEEVDDGRIAFVHDGEETVPSYTLTVRDPLGLTDTDAADINYTSVNDGPEITVATLTVSEGGSQVINPSVLNAVDPDHEDSELTYTVDSTQGGEFVKSGTGVTSFTQQDIEDGLVSFQHDGSETEPDYLVTVRDPLGLSDTANADVNYTSVNDGPEIKVFDLTVAEGGAQTFAPATLDAVDPDNTDAELTYNVVSVDGGEFQKDGVTTTTFTQEDVNAGKVAYVHDGSETEPTATIRVADPLGLFDTEDAAVSYTPVNDAPEITVAELTVEEGGTQVMTSSVLSATDPDNVATELTFTVDSVTAGEFQKGGVGVTQFTQSDLDNGVVNFVHDGSEVEPDYIVTVRDPDLAFDTADAEVNYTPVNDAPEILTNELTINRAQTLLVTNSILSTGDPDHDPEDLTIEVSNVEHGFFANSMTPAVPITSFTQADIDDGRVAFVHDGGTDGPSYDVKVTDPLGLFDTGSVDVDFTTFPLSPKITAVGLNLPEDPSSISIMVDDFSDLSGETYATSDRLGSGSYWSGDAAIASGGAGTRNGQVFEEGDGQKTMSATADGTYIFNNTLGNPSDTTNPIFSTDDVQLLAGASYTVNIDVASHQAFNYPNLQLYINDELIGSKLTNSTAWKTYSLDFTVPEGVTAVDIKVINSTATDVGNDFGMDNITLDLNAFEVSVKDFNISVVDPDTEPVDILISVDNVVSGAFVFASDPSVALSQFTLEDVLTEKLKFFHLAQEDIATYDLTASDPDGNSDSIQGSVGQPPNDAPVFDNLVIDLGTEDVKVLDSSDISVVDPDATPSILNILVRDITGGQFELVSTSGIAIDSFSQQQINDGEIQFRRFDSAVDIEYQLEVTDGATVVLDTGTASRTAGPIVLDLDGDGVEFRSVEEGIHFDADGDGVAEQIAWAGKEDAVLFYDANDDGQVGGREEVVLSDYGQEGSTDLDGLRTFDSDGDGQLSAGDAEFEKFGMWQDADGDGIASEGEVVKLTVAGVQSIDLGSDGEGYVALDGDVEVFGTTQLTYEDGQVIDAADAAFDYIELANADEPIVIEADSGEEIVVEAPIADEFGIIAEVVDESEVFVSAPSATDSSDEEALVAAAAAA